MSRKERGEVGGRVSKFVTDGQEGECVDNMSSVIFEYLLRVKGNMVGWGVLKEAYEFITVCKGMGRCGDRHTDRHVTRVVQQH